MHMQPLGLCTVELHTLLTVLEVVYTGAGGLNLLARVINLLARVTAA